jgi:hypothetical protein
MKFNALRLTKDLSRNIVGNVLKHSYLFQVLVKNPISSVSASQV